MDVDRTSPHGSGLKVHLGCGESALPGFLNIDARPGLGVDIVADISDLTFLENDSCDLIYCSHVLEHLPTAAVAPFLRQCHARLRERGRLMVAVPDLENIFRQYLDDPYVFGASISEVVGYVFGAQDHEQNFHRTGFTYEILRGQLLSAGFDQVRRYDAFTVGANDASLAVTYRGAVSLNVEASRGAFSSGHPIPLRRMGVFHGVVRFCFRLLFWVDARLRAAFAALLSRFPRG